jgi:hypothetical protein
MQTIYFIAIAIVSYIVIMAVKQAGYVEPTTPRKRRHTGNRVNVNINGRHARTIVVKAHTRTI